MKILKYLKSLSRFEAGLLLFSLVSVTLSFLLSPDKDVLSLCASLVGVTGLIFIAKGMVVGQVLIVAFSVLYGIISLQFGYYGEMITYLGMSAPAAIFAIVSWLRHPYEKGECVEIAKKLSRKSRLLLFALTVLMTVAFYFILGALETKNLIFSTISVATSFLASGLLFLRSPYYALAYASNDIVLITLWILATVANLAYLPMIFCFAVFFMNDIYGFINWRKMKKAQS